MPARTPSPQNAVPVEENDTPKEDDPPALVEELDAERTEELELRADERSELLVREDDELDIRTLEVVELVEEDLLLTEEEFPREELKPVDEENPREEDDDATPPAQ